VLKDLVLVKSRSSHSNF